MAVAAVKYINTIDIVCLVSLRNLRSLVIIFPYLTKFSNLPKFPIITGYSRKHGLLWVKLGRQGNFPECSSSPHNPWLVFHTFHNFTPFTGGGGSVNYVNRLIWVINEIREFKDYFSKFPNLPKFPNILQRAEVLPSAPRLSCAIAP